MGSLGASVSVWIDTTTDTTFPPLSGNVSVDVAIVGGGITGLTAAVLLKRAGVSVAVIEASQIGSGVSGYTTAHITEAADERYKNLISKFGEENAKLVAQSNRAAIKRIAAFVKELQLDCDFQRLPGYLYAEKKKDISLLEKEAEAACQLDIPATFTNVVPLPFPVKAGVLFPDQAQFHSLKYLQGLAKAISGGGCYIFEQSFVTNITGDKPCQLQTEFGTVKAEHVILATHTPISNPSMLPDVLLLHAKIVPYRSYVLGVRLKEQQAPLGLFWDTAEPYHYTRSYTDASGELLIVGGGDHKTGNIANTEQSYEQLEAYARSRYHVASIDYRWSAQLYEPVDGLPYIGKSLAHSNVYVATGYSGNGMTFGTVAGMLLTDLILGRKNPWIELYDPNRVKPLAGVQMFVLENLDVARHFVVDRFKQDVREPSDVQPGEGKILNINGERVAVYRDETGVEHALSPVCTHLGCIVNWNNTEKSWDCPCHGGRFSCTGQVLNGPPVKALEPKQLS